MLTSRERIHWQTCLSLTTASRTGPSQFNGERAAGPDRAWEEASPYPFPISFIVIAVSASVAVEITAGASGAQKGEWRLGSVRPSFFAASYSACGTPPTQTIRLLMLLSSRPKRPKSSPPITGGILTTRSLPKLVVRSEEHTSELQSLI